MGYIKKLREEYIEKYLENSKCFNFRDLDFKKFKVERHLYKDLANVDLKGYFPFASEYVDKDFNPTTSDKGDLCYYFLPVLHELYIGTTGSGKTTGCVEPQLRAISALKHKPHLFLTDPKGELFERNAKHLKKQGYKIFTLNFKDIDLSDRWNPLHEMYDVNYKIKEILKAPLMRSLPVKENIIKYNKDSEYEDVYYLKDNYAFANYKDVMNYISNLENSLKSDVEDLVNEFVSMVIQVKSSKDPSWEEGAKRLLKGIIYAMLEDSVNNSTKFTKKMMNIKTIKDLYHKMTSQAHNVGGVFNLLENEPFHYKKPDDYSIELMRPSMENANNTRRSYLTVFDTATHKWFDDKIVHLTLDNTIDIDNIGEQPFAIFLITRDYEKNDFLVAGLFIDWLYRKMIERSEKTNKPEELHFILDEFGNIPHIRDFENKIATSRSRNIWFHLVVQSYAQIQTVYDEIGRSTKSNVIIDNCNAQIFLGSQHYPTRERFSLECGSHNVLDLDSEIGQKETSFKTLPLIPLSRLDNITPGDIYIKRIFTPVLKSTFIRSYLAKEYKVDNFKGFEIIDKRKQIFNLSKYTYIPPAMPKRQQSPFDWI